MRKLKGNGVIYNEGKFICDSQYEISVQDPIGPKSGYANGKILLINNILYDLTFNNSELLTLELENGESVKFSIIQGNFGEWSSIQISGKVGS